jgi:nitroreductase
MNVLEAIRSKRAVRQFAAKAVSHDDIVAILDAARRAQSSKNTQPWQFVVIEDRETLKELSKAGDYTQYLPSSAFAVIFVSEEDTAWVNFDLGQASSYMQLAAWELGIGSCLIAFHRQEQAHDVLRIPSGMHCMGGIDFGYPAPDWTPAKMGGRKPIEDIAHWNKW